MTEFVVNGMAAFRRPVPLLAWRLVALSAFAGLLLSTSGAFDTEAAAFLPRFAYWLLVAAVSTLALEACHRSLPRLGFTGPNWQLRGVGLLLLLVPLTILASLGCKLLFGRPVRMAGYTTLLPGMTSILVSLQLLIAFFSPPRSEAEAAQPPLDDLRSSLPLPLRAARIRAIEAEDHYVRVHTSAGQALVRMRLRDAVACLSDKDGLQPHRSWWIATDEIVGLSRSDGRATLKLEGGLEVPVSRKAAQALGPDFGA